VDAFPAAQPRGTEPGASELVSDIVEKVVAIVDDVGLVDGEHRARGWSWCSREVAVREDRYEAGNSRQVSSGFCLSDFWDGGPMTPRGWPEPVVVDVEDHSVLGPVQPPAKIPV
jgi:hypothetical protein